MSDGRTRHGGLLIALNAVGAHARRDWPDSVTLAESWRRIGELAERGRFHALFLADAPALRAAVPSVFGQPEPSVLLSFVAESTKHIGLVSTLTTSLNDPWDLAQRLATLDVLSGGRAAWNVVTTRDLAAYENFGQYGIPPTERRYEVAEEFVHRVRRHWREHPRFGSPQGTPVLLQAGGSAQGRRLAGRVGEAVFSAELSLEAAQLHYREVKDHAVEAGRSPDEVSILPGLSLLIADSEDEASEIFDSRHGRYDGQALVAQVTKQTGIPFAEIEWDASFPEAYVQLRPVDGFRNSLGFREAAIRAIRERGFTPRQFLRYAHHHGSGHSRYLGTPEGLADRIESWYKAGAVDGFTLLPERIPQDIELFVERVVPILQQRGIFHRAYEADTFRDLLRSQTSPGLRRAS